MRLRLDADQRRALQRPFARAMDPNGLVGFSAVRRTEFGLMARILTVNK